MSRLGVVGAGRWGQNIARALRRLGALHMVCDTAPDRGAAAHPTAFTTELSDLIDACEAVVVATPAETHYEVARRCLEAGRDVLVEKPLCLTSADGEALVKLAADRQRVLMVGHVLHYHPAIVQLKELVRSGSLGRLRYAYASRLNLGRFRRSEDVLWSFAPHDVSLVLSLAEEQPNRVEATGCDYVRPGVHDVTMMHLGFPSGLRAHLFVSWIHPFKEQKLFVLGERGMAVFDGIADTLTLYRGLVDWTGSAPEPGNVQGEQVDYERGECLLEECRHFLGCVRTHGAPRTPGEEGVDVLRVLERATGGEASGVHPTAIVDSGVEIGDGTRVWHFSHLLGGTRAGKECRIGQNVVIGPNVRVGDNVKIQNNVSVYEGVELEDDVFVGPSAVFTNVINPRSEVPRMSELRRTLVQRGASIGANSTILCGVTVGEYAFVGAGAVVTKDVPSYAQVVGNPARVVGWRCRCGEKLSGASGILRCGCGAEYPDLEASG